MGNKQVKATPQFKSFEENITNVVVNYMNNYSQGINSDVFTNQVIKVNVGGDLNCGNLVLATNAKISIVALSLMDEAVINSLNANIIAHMQDNLKLLLSQVNETKQLQIPPAAIGKDVIDITTITKTNLETNITNTIKNTIINNVSVDQTIELNVDGDINSDNCNFTNASVVSILALQITSSVINTVLNNASVLKILENYKDENGGGDGDGTGGGDGDGTGGGDGDGTGGGDGDGTGGGGLPEYLGLIVFLAIVLLAILWLIYYYYKSR